MKGRPEVHRSLPRTDRYITSPEQRQTPTTSSAITHQDPVCLRRETGLMIAEAVRYMSVD